MINLHNFKSSERGTVAILMAFFITLLMMFAGMALDFARAMHVRQIVQDSLDSAALAAAKRFEDPTVTDEEIVNTAKVYFEANAKPATAIAKLTDFKAVPDRATSQVSTTVNIDMPMMLSAAAPGNVKSLKIKPGATTKYDQTLIEVAMVLDITGSMLDPAPDGKIKLETLKIAAKEFADVLYAGSPRAGLVRVSVVPYSTSVNVGPYASLVAGPGLDDCVVEREGSNAYTDQVASAINSLGRMDTSIAPYYLCPTSPVRPLSDLSLSSNRTAFNAAIDGLQGNGGTGGHMGLAWGWYVLSNKWSSVFGTSAAVAPSSNVRKIILLMTDGMFNTAYKNGGLAVPAAQIYDPTLNGTSGYQALQLCNNIKKAGDYKVYSVGFAAPAEAAALLKQCTGADNYYDATDSSKLLTAFRDIATKLTSLRLSS